MAKFWELFQESVIVTSTIALVLIITACYLWATGQPVPDGLTYCLGLVLGFFFGVKTEKKIQATREG